MKKFFKFRKRVRILYGEWDMIPTVYRAATKGGEQYPSTSSRLDQHRLVVSKYSRRIVKCKEISYLMRSEMMQYFVIRSQCSLRNSSDCSLIADRRSR